MYNNSKDAGCYAAPAAELPRGTFRDDALNAMAEINDRLRRINNTLTEISGNSHMVTSDGKRQEPSCFTEDLMLRFGDTFTLLSEIDEKLRRVI